MTHATRRLRAVPTVSDEPLSPPHDHAAEASVLGAVLLTPSVERGGRCSNATLAKVAALLRPQDFDLPAHREFFECFQALDAKGLPIDVKTACAELRARGRLHTVGGAQAVAELYEGAITVAHVEAHATIVADLAALRRVQNGLRAALGAVERAEGGPRAAVERAHTALASLIEVRRRHGVTADEHARKALDALLAAVKARAEGRYLAARFGLECLDGAASAEGAHGGLLGGILPARVVTVSGLPGAGKTTLVTQAAILTALDGGRVLWFSTEIPGHEVATRYACQSCTPPISQVDALAGCVPDEMLDLLKDGLQRFARLPLNIYSDDLSIDAIAATVASEVAESARDGRPVRLVVLDYFQDLEESDRESEVAEAKYRARRVKDISREHGVGVLVVSAVKKSAEERAAKGERATTGNLHGAGINYASDVVIELRRADPDDRSEVVDVTLEITKARYGATGSPVVRFDMPRGRFYEVVSESGAIDPMEGL